MCSMRIQGCTCVWSAAGWLLEALLALCSTGSVGKRRRMLVGTSSVWRVPATLASVPMGSTTAGSVACSCYGSMDGSVQTALYRAVWSPVLSMRSTETQNL
jgi:hypothetical protein